MKLCSVCGLIPVELEYGICRKCLDEAQVYEEVRR